MTNFDVDDNVQLQNTIWTGASGTPKLPTGYTPTRGPVMAGAGGLFNLYDAASGTG